MNLAHHGSRPGAAIALALLLCHGAQAQVLRCQVEGRAVFQSGPCAVEARVASNATPTPPAAPATATATASKKRTLADMLRERDGAERPRPTARDFQGDGANVLRARMGAL